MKQHFLGERNTDCKELFGSMGYHQKRKTQRPCVLLSLYGLTDKRYSQNDARYNAFNIYQISE